MLDYASWVNGLSFEKIDEIASDYLEKPLVDAFRDHFQEDLPDTINSDHRMLIVASELDDSSERIVQYLSSRHSLDINVVFFTCFQRNGCEFVGRSWLMDPKVVEERKPPSSPGISKKTMRELRGYFEGGDAWSIEQLAEKTGKKEGTVRIQIRNLIKGRVPEIGVVKIVKTDDGKYKEVK